MPRLSTFLNRHLSGTNLEVLKFGMYIAFPIGWMYYFGTNLDNRFAVPSFWPTNEQTNKIPIDRGEVKEELDRLRERRLRNRDRRLAREEAAAARAADEEEH